MHWRAFNYNGLDHIQGTRNMCGCVCKQTAKLLRQDEKGAYRQHKMITLLRVATYVDVRVDKHGHGHISYSTLCRNSYHQTIFCVMKICFPATNTRWMAYFFCKFKPFYGKQNLSSSKAIYLCACLSIFVSVSLSIHRIENWQPNRSTNLPSIAISSTIALYGFVISRKIPKKSKISITFTNNNNNRRKNTHNNISITVIKRKQSHSHECEIRAFVV